MSRNFFKRILLAILATVAGVQCFDANELSRLHQKIGSAMRHERTQAPARRLSLTSAKQGGVVPALRDRHRSPNDRYLRPIGRGAAAPRQLLDTKITETELDEEPTDNFDTYKIGPKGKGLTLTSGSRSPAPRFLKDKTIGDDEIIVTYEPLKPTASKKLTEFAKKSKAKKPADKKVKAKKERKLLDEDLADNDVSKLISSKKQQAKPEKLKNASKKPAALSLKNEAKAAKKGEALAAATGPAKARKACGCGGRKASLNGKERVTCGCAGKTAAVVAKAAAKKAKKGKKAAKKSSKKGAKAKQVRGLKDEAGAAKKARRLDDRLSFVDYDRVSNKGYSRLSVI